MARRQNRSVKTIPMKVGNDPALWRYSSMQEALSAGSAVLAQLIREGERLNQNTCVDEISPERVEESRIARTA
jgi:hypothetical protein